MEDIMPQRPEELDFILDLNALGEDFTLRGMALEIFFTGTREQGHHILVPETTLDEFAAKYRHKIRDLNTWQDWIHQEYKRIGGRRSNPGAELLPEEEEFQEFHNRQGTWLRSQGVNLIAFPTVDPKIISTKAIHQKLPFKDPSTGYRDCMVWFALLAEQSGTENTTVLVSSSRAGFGHDKPNHIDLQSDLLEYKIDPDSVVVLNSVDEANHRFLIPNFAPVEDVEQFLAGGQTLDLQNWVKDNILAVAEAQGWARQVAGMAETSAKVTVTGVKELHDLHLDDVRKLDAQRVLLFAHAATLIEANVEYTARDYYSDSVLPEVLRPSDPTEGSVFMEMESIIAFSLILDIQTSKVTKAEIDAVEGNGYNYVHLSHPWHRIDNSRGES